MKTKRPPLAVLFLSLGAALLVLAAALIYVPAGIALAGLAALAAGMVLDIPGPGAGGRKR